MIIKKAECPSMRKDKFKNSLRRYTHFPCKFSSYGMLFAILLGILTSCKCYKAENTEELFSRPNEAEKIIALNRDEAGQRYDVVSMTILVDTNKNWGLVANTIDCQRSSFFYEGELGADPFFPLSIQWIEDKGISRGNTFCKLSSQLLSCDSDTSWADISVLINNKDFDEYVNAGYAPIKLNISIKEKGRNKVKISGVLFVAPKWQSNEIKPDSFVIEIPFEKETEIGERHMMDVFYNIKGITGSKSAWKSYTIETNEDRKIKSWDSLWSR